MMQVTNMPRGWHLWGRLEQWVAQLRAAFAMITLVRPESEAIDWEDGEPR